MKLKDFSEIINRLAIITPNADVLVNGYEDGYEDVELEQLNFIEYGRDVYNEFYYGSHSEPRKGKKIRTGLLIQR